MIRKFLQKQDLNYKKQKGGSSIYVIYCVKPYASYSHKSGKKKKTCIFFYKTNILLLGRHFC